MHLDRRHVRILRTVLAACGLGLLAQCALINTYYNARVAFTIGHREHVKQMKPFADSLVAPSGMALTNYDRTVVKCQKVLEVYRKQKRWHDDAVFLMGRAYFYKREMVSAIRQFRRIQEEFPLSKYLPESYYYLAQAYIYEERYQKAEEVLEIIANRYPELNRDDRVSLLQARLALRREGKAQAIELLMSALGSAATVERKMELTAQIATLLKQMGQCERALPLLRQCPRERKLPGPMYEVDYLQLGCLLDMDSLEQVVDWAQTMLKQKGYASHDPAILLKKAAALALLGRIDEAIKLYERIAREYDTSPDAGLAWYELGVLYHKVKFDYTKAAECYLKASALAKDSSVTATAASRARALAMLDTTRAHRESPRDSLDSVRTQASWDLKLAELFWLELAQPDSAYAHFRAMLSDTAAPDSMAEKALFAAGYIALHSMGDTLGADSLFGLLRARYPASEFAKRSQRERGLEETVRTRVDSAEAAFAEAEKLYLDKSEPARAIEAYLKVFQEYPDCDAGGRSLYAAAWLSDNVTFSKDVAQFLYKKVCEKYPKSQWCELATKPRLRAASDSTIVRRERNRAAGIVDSADTKDSRTPGKR